MCLLELNKCSRLTCSALLPNVAFVCRCEDPQHAAGGLARSFCMALLPHLSLLRPLSPLGLRAQMGPDQVGYEAGAGGKPLPAICQEPLDGALVPLLSNAREPLHLELVFHILYQ